MARSNLFRFLAAIFLTCALFFSCKKDDSPGYQPDLPDLQTRVTSSISGFVTDENDLPVSGAAVKVGTITSSTDQYGFFSFTDVEVIKNAALVTVTHSGYFKGMRSYVAEAGNPAMVRIKLLPKTVVGSIDAAAGGSATAADGLKVELPASGVVDNAGAAYTGAVTVSAKWLNPAADDFSQIMPGDLRALNTLGEMRTLLSYGMAAVELTGSAGQALQVAPGKKSTVSFPLPSTLQGPAPTSIPLWHFDEEKGLWIEEGSATKIGDRYVGEVSHFSFWNCDVPIDFVELNLTVVDLNGAPVPYAKVRLSTLTSPFTSAQGFTNASGYVNGIVPANTDLVMRIYTGNNCTTPLYTQNIPASAIDVSLGNISIAATALANVSGTVVNCSMQPVANGYIIMSVSGTYYRYPLNNNGSFNYNFPGCSSGQNASLIAVDASANEQSALTDHTIVPGSNVIGQIQACGISTVEFFNYSIDAPGVHQSNISFSNAPGDSAFQESAWAEVAISAENTSTGNWVILRMDDQAIAAGSSQTAWSFLDSDLYNLGMVQLTPRPTNNQVHITEYGTIGQFISGTFNLTFESYPGQPDMQVSGEFRVRRRY